MNIREAFESGRRVRRQKWTMHDISCWYLEPGSGRISVEDVLADDWEVAPEGWDEFTEDEKREHIKNPVTPVTPAEPIQTFEAEVEELVEAALVMGARRGTEAYVTHAAAKIIVEQLIPSMTRRFLGLIAKHRRVGASEVEVIYKESIGHFEAHEKERELIEKFLDQRFTCRANWTSGIEFYNENDLPELLEQFLFWWTDNQ